MFLGGVLCLLVGVGGHGSSSCVAVVACSLLPFVVSCCSLLLVVVLWRSLLLVVAVLWCLSLLLLVAVVL